MQQMLQKCTEAAKAKCTKAAILQTLQQNRLFLGSAITGILLFTRPALHYFVSDAGLLALLLFFCGFFVFPVYPMKKSREKAAADLMTLLSTLYGMYQFATTWLPSSKVAAMAGVFHLSSASFLYMVAFFLAILSFHAFRTLSHMILFGLNASIEKIKEQHIAIRVISFVCLHVLAALLIVYIMQYMMMGKMTLSNINLRRNAACVLCIYLLFLLFSLRVQLSFLLTTLLITIFAVGNYAVYQFRGTELRPMDLLSLQTAANVADSYQLEPSLTFLRIVLIALLFMCFLLSQKPIKGKGLRLRGGVLLLLIALSISTYFDVVDMKIYRWINYGTKNNGTLVNFLLEIKDLFPETPQGYTLENIAAYEGLYAKTDAEDATDTADATDSVQPTILIIMDESFADFSILGDNFNTNTEVLPYFHSLTENTIKGYALSSIYGGSTANSEYEVLTGNSLAFLADGIVAYQQYVDDKTSSIAWILRRYGYSTFATHPFRSSGWMRTIAWPNLGFSAYTFIDDYPQENLLRKYISDQEAFEQLIAYYEQFSGDLPLFLFSVTMQNHGSFTYEEEDFETTISLIDYDGTYPKAEQYLSLIHETDKALETLITYFESVAEPVVILFYGDHLPNIEKDFYQEIHGGAFNTLAEQELLYTVPFFIWANYDIEEATDVYTSLNYLSVLLFETAGLELSSYQTFLKDLSAVIPAINSQGYYSLSAEDFISISEATGEEAAWLAMYEEIQYNGVIDTANSSEVFFPLAE